MRRFMVLLGVLVLQAYAQTSAGRVSGVITDSSGAVVPGAKVTATSVETGIESAVTSNPEGNYVLYPLPPGVYNITVQASGFRGERLDRMQVDVAAVLKHDFHMEVGALEQEVIVSAKSLPMLTQSASVESTVIQEQIESLPLNGRNFNDLVLLSAGAVENPGNAGIAHDFGPVALNGNRSFSNDYQLDKTPNNDPFTGSSSGAVSVDVIREFKVTSGLAPAEYGQAGSQVTMVTRSGANQFHGSAYEYYRGTTWQASNPFTPGAPQPFDHNQFGGSIGGPIRPNHTFFFFNYEGNRQNSTATQVDTVPPDAFWKGDFSSLLSRNIALTDPLSTGRPAFPGNIIPASRLDKIALNLRPYWGSPTISGLVNNLTVPADSTNTGNQFTARIDQTLPRYQNLSLRYTQAPSQSFTPSILGLGIGTLNHGVNDNASIGWTAPISPRTVNEVHAGYAEFLLASTYPNPGLPTTASLGMQGFLPLNPTRAPVPNIAFTGIDAFTSLNYSYSPASNPAANDLMNKTLNLSESITHVRGNHTIKAGIEYRHLDLPSMIAANAGGVVTFQGRAANAQSTGYSFADFLLSLPVSSQQVIPMAKALYKQQLFASYIQDDWRATRRLTLMLGLRHELLQNPTEAQNRLAMFDPANGAIVVASNNGKLPTGQYQPIVVAELSDGNGNWRFPLMSDQQAGLNPGTLIQPHYRYFGPRLGFAYQIDASGKTLVRGGYGIFYTTYPFRYLLQTTSINPPFAGSYTFNQAFANGVPAVTLEAPFPGKSSALVAPSGLQSNFTLPDNQQWNLTVERELGGGLVFSLGYVGNKGSHLFRSVNPNGPRLDPVTHLVVRPYTATYGTAGINERITDGNSIFSAMQTQVRRRARKDLIFQASWTWAKGVDDVGTTVNATALDVTDTGRDRANSDYVLRHTVKFNGTYDLPFGRGRAYASTAPRWLDAAIGGWRLSGLWTWTTGRPFTPTFSSTGTLGNNRPDVVYGVQANLPAGDRTPSHWFNPAAFAAVPAVDPVTGLPRFGDAGRNILIGPGTNVVDSSLAKSFPVFGEARRLTFRVEMFNTLNHPNYDFPAANISSPNTVATVSNIIKPMRQAQFVWRFDF